MRKLRSAFRVVLASAGMLSVILGGVAPAFSGAGGGSDQEVSAGIVTSCEEGSARPAHPEKQLLSDEEMKELNEASAQSSNLGSMTGGDHHADIHLHAEEVILIILGVLLIILILVIIF